MTDVPVEQPLLRVVDQVMTSGRQSEGLRRPKEKVLLARDGYERYIDSKLDPADSLAARIPAGLEEAWDAASARTEGTELLRYEAMGAHPGGGWLWTIGALDLADGRRLYTELPSGDTPEPGIFLIAVTDRPSAGTDRAVVEAFRASEAGQELEMSEEAEWHGDDAPVAANDRSEPGDWQDFLEEDDWLVDSPLADALPKVFGRSLDDGSKHFFIEAFEKTTTKWRQLYDPAVLDADAEVALRMMISRVAETPAIGPPIEDYDPRLSKILVTGLGGYVWRLAERQAGRSIDHERAKIEEAIGAFKPDAFSASLGVTRRQEILFQASAGCLALRIPLWHTSPGYLIWGVNLFRVGARWVVQETPFETNGLAPQYLFYAFYFGVALFHVHEQLREPSVQPGGVVGPNWEHCEIVLRGSPSVFVAEAEGGAGRYDAAVSGRLPRFRFGLLEGRDYRKLERCHDELVRRLEGAGWVKTATSGEHWYCTRFRRRLTS